MRRRQWHPTLVLSPGKSHGQRSVVAAVHGVTMSQARLSDFTFTFHFHALEEEMVTHSRNLAWRIPGTGLPSVGSHRVRHDWSDLAAAAAAASTDDAENDWGREEKEAAKDEMVGWHDWLSGCEFEQTPVDNEGQKRMACCSLRELDTT